MADSLEPGATGGVSGGQPGVPFGSGGRPSPNPEGAERHHSAETDSSILEDVRVGAHGGGGGGRARFARVDATTGSVPRKLWGLAWPQMMESSLNIADQLVDLVWAGRLPGGFRSVAAVGVAQTFVQFGFMTRQGLDQSLRAMVSRAVGAGNMRLANHIALQGFSLAVVYSLLMVLIGLFVTDVILRLVGTSAEVQAQTAVYLRIQFIGLAGTAFRMQSASVLQAAGDVMTPLKATMLARVSHIILSPLLMFGWGWFPEYGLAGAAIANVVAQFGGAAFNFHALFRGSTPIHLTLRGYRTDYPLIWRMLKIAAPASIAGSERATVQVLLLRLVTPFGDVALAAYALTRRLETFTFLGSMGLGNAAGIMVGQNLGAGHPDRAKQSIGWALVFSALVGVTLGGMLFLFPAFFIRIFTSNQEVVDLTTVWLRIQVFAALITGAQLMFQQSYNTAGDTLAPMVVTLVAVWAVELPVAWFLTQSTGIGPVGIGFANVSAMSFRFACYIPYFYWGRWLRVKVI